jgi:hypothetical protein
MQLCMPNCAFADNLYLTMVRHPLQVMPFFNSVGFQLPDRKGIADFLQEVTSPKDQGQHERKLHRSSQFARRLKLLLASPVF